MSATHPAFFLGRAELLGSIACQMMDALHPGVVPLKKVDFNAKDEYSMINNYKVLQEVFNKVNVDKYIEVGQPPRPSLGPPFELDH
ncbi:uncharacterized protein HaLaN_26328 [Haematococcus lacustris]|uniref:Calponin-homology (CH) domain-containing protein n=1 Tax=Haematococcus lacustris TaxID=44745 RepID=A0A6A0A5Z4_HAELA|nr:uncharacterized protein HaLaN_26328 [Haematococcus lacustris]